MSHASNREPARVRTHNERWQHWIALLLSALLHVLMAVLLLYAAKPTMSTPQGAAGGSRIKVDFIGETKRPEHPVPPRPTPTPAQAPAHHRTARAASPVQSTLVAHADDPVPPTDTATQPNENTPTPSSEEPTAVTPPLPSPAQDTPTPSQAQTIASTPPPPTERHPQTWTGRPPGALDTDTAPDNSGLADGPGNHGNRRDLDASQPSLEVGGYLVYYDLGSQTQLRAWQRQGMKELFILLPGTEYRMVCPLEIALSRGSGKCRALPPDSPELKTIGDARQVITMLQVYHHGELVWRGPGPYR